jgi:hypothetical protein
MVTVLLGLGTTALEGYWYGVADYPGVAPRTRPILSWQDLLPFLISNVVAAVGFLAFPTLGALIVTRAKARRIGWLYCAIGLTVLVDSFSGDYAVVALVLAPNTLPARLVFAWIQTWSWVVGVSLFVIFLPLLYPTGRLLSRRWRPVAVCAIGLIGGGTIYAAIKPGPLGNHVADVGATIANPLGVAALAPVGGIVGLIFFLVLLLLVLSSAASLLLRLRRSRGEERQQLKWFTYAIALVVAMFVSDNLLYSFLPHDAMVLALDAAFTLLLPIALAFLPLATGLAILRYHLFDIDRLINKALVYGLLTGILAVVFVGGVIGLQQAFRATTGQDSPIALVASTLLIAGLFQPLRARIQKIIDRRFYRSKYDAQKTLAAFTATLRQEVSLPELQERLVGVVKETMQPAHVSLWLRQADAQADNLSPPSR